METHTGQLAQPKIASSGYSIPLDYAAIAVTFFALGFWAAVIAIRAAANQVRVIR